MKPMWLEDPLGVDYSESWLRLVNSTTVPILMGENLDRKQRFKDFIVNQACDIVHLDVRNTGGLLEAKKITDLADTFNMPMAALFQPQPQNRQRMRREGITEAIVHDRS